MTEEGYSIYCASDNWERVVSKINEMPGWVCVDQSAMRVNCETPNGEIKISGLVPEVGGKFGPIYAGTVNRAKRIVTDDTVRREELVKSLKSTNMILGCVMRPEMVDKDVRFKFVLSLADILDGVIFDTFTFVARNGEVILSLDGTH